MLHKYNSELIYFKNHYFRNMKNENKPSRQWIIWEHLPTTSCFGIIASLHWVLPLHFSQPSRDGYRLWPGKKNAFLYPYTQLRSIQKKSASKSTITLPNIFKNLVRIAIFDSVSVSRQPQYPQGFIFFLLHAAENRLAPTWGNYPRLPSHVKGRVKSLLVVWRRPQLEPSSLPASTQCQFSNLRVKNSPA